MPDYILCPRCEEQIVLGVKSCPSCGASFDPSLLAKPRILAAWDAYGATSTRGRIVVWVVVLLFVLAIVAHLQGLV
jgi:hypothetical protein